ncbi:MAG: RNA polymerase sigma factor [Bacteroidetes bacterium]|nr:RNA polymerase sigma factor [Bacteroidota bacterium]MBK8143571.1 RNA polymerase sigma factor [Bacteroidota bacterium]MBP6314066.1 RNA polymerase sigma factor [Chitinophagaceae bacterium]
MFLFKKNIDSDSSDETLMRLLLKGNKLAFELLYERYFDKMVWYAFGYLNDIPKAEDIVQEVFIKIIQAPEKFDVNKKFSTWIYTITGNRCKNQLRDERNQQLPLTEAIGSNWSVAPQSHVDVNYLRQILDEKFESLSEKEQQIFTLRFSQQLSIREIAAIMNIPEGSVKSGIFYLLKKYTHIFNYYNYET